MAAALAVVHRAQGPAEIPASAYLISDQSQLSTNHPALTYTTTDVWQDDAEGVRNISSSLMYRPSSPVGPNTQLDFNCGMKNADNQLLQKTCGAMSSLWCVLASSLEFRGDTFTCAVSMLGFTSLAKLGVMRMIGPAQMS